MMFVIITTTVQFCSQTIRQKSLIVLAMGPAKHQSLQGLAQGRLRVHNKEKNSHWLFLLSRAQSEPLMA